MAQSIAGSVSHSIDVSLAERRQRLRSLANRAISSSSPQRIFTPPRTSRSTGNSPSRAVRTTPNDAAATISTPRGELRRLEELLSVPIPHSARPPAPPCPGSARSACGSARTAQDSLSWTRQRIRRLSYRSAGTAGTTPPTVPIAVKARLPASPKSMEEGSGEVLTTTPDSMAKPTHDFAHPQKSFHTLTSSPAKTRTATAAPPSGPVYSPRSNDLRFDGAGPAKEVAREAKARHIASLTAPNDAVGVEDFAVDGLPPPLEDPWLLLAAAQSALHVVHTQRQALESALESERTARRAAESEAAELRLKIKSLLSCGVEVNTLSTATCTRSDNCEAAGILARARPDDPQQMIHTEASRDQDTPGGITHMGSPAMDSRECAETARPSDSTRVLTPSRPTCTAGQRDIHATAAAILESAIPGALPVSKIAVHARRSSPATDELRPVVGAGPVIDDFDDDEPDNELFS